MPISIGPNTSLQQLQTYSKENVGTNQKIYSKTTTSCWSGNSTTKLHGSIFMGNDASFQTAKQDVIDILTQHIGQAAAQSITSDVFVENQALTGGQLKQVTDRAIIKQQMTELTNAVNTGANDGSCVATQDCQRNGEFDTFLAGKPFDGLVAGFADLAKSHDAAFVAQEIRSAASDLKNIDRAVAKEFLAAVLSNRSLSRILNQQSADAPLSFVSLMDEAQGSPSKLPLQFESFQGDSNGITVDIGNRLGKGGMGGAVYLATDRATGEQYAIKHQSHSHYKVDIDSMNEELHTPGNLASTKSGKDTYMLMKLGEKVDFSKLSTDDLRNVFLDLGKAHNFSDNFMNQDIPDYGFIHNDIHQGNMMMVDGKLSLIDYGRYAEFTDQTVNRETSSLTRSIFNDFKQNYDGDIELKNEIPANADMRQVNCATLTRELTKRILFQVKKDHGLDITISKDADLFYKEMKEALPTLMEQAPEAGLQVATLVSLYEKQMAAIFNGTPFTAEDSAAHFGGAASTRTRSNTI